MSESAISIGRLSRETGAKISTIRYYESIGLLLKPGRSAGNTRLYQPVDKARLAFILHCRELGFTQAAIRELLELTDHPEASCEKATLISTRHLDAVNQKLAQLTNLKAELENMITACEGGKVADCRLIETLADFTHQKCMSPDHQ